MNEEIVIRKAEPGDLRFLYELRTDPAVVEASVTGEGVEWHVHVLWFDQKLHEGALLFVAEVGDVPVGYIRFDPIGGDHTTLEVAVGLVERYRNKGLGRAVIRLGSRLAEAIGARTLTALIKPENTPSKRAFEAAGYVLDSEGLRVGSGAGVVLDRFRRSLKFEGDSSRDQRLQGRCQDVGAGSATSILSRPYRILLVADYGGGAGLGHLRRMRALGEALTALGSGYAMAVMRAPARGGELEAAEDRGSGATAEVAACRPLLELDDLSWCRRAFDAAVLDSYRASPDDAAMIDPTAALADGSPPPMKVPIVVDPAPGAREETYRDRAQRVLAGEKYALLTSAFWDLVPEPPTFPPRRILVSLGAAADEDFVSAVTAAVHDAVPDPEIVRPGAGKGPEEYFSALCSVDLVVTAGGMSSLEAARAGKPMVGVVLSPNHRQNVEGLARGGALLASKPRPDAIADAAKRVTEDQGLFRSLAASGPKIVDGKGACRTASALVEYVRNE